MSPFREFRVGSWEMNYNFRPGHLTADTKVNYNEQIISVDLNQQYKIGNNQRMIDGSLTVDTPFRGETT